MKSMHSVCLLAITAAILAGRPVRAEGYSPEEAIKRMKVADGFEVKVVAAEPMIRQPVTMTFDDRGRLWVLQYLQYPTPNGLKPVEVDQFLRTKYDRLPEPPPRGPRGADRITILEDPDANGRFRKAKDFVGGLNLASGMALGHGGVFVAQPPYLLFYSDKNGDDVPDGDPEVLLTGFGMEDAHAFANSLTWGADGWLYGAHGSTVTAKIRGIEFQQGIWRYHPITRDFELFSEGGGNTWGLDFDRHGNIIASTNWGTSTSLHQVQGGYYVKGFGKHGPLHNPHSYGYFDHVPHKDFKGGHVTIGGVVYRGGAFPKEFDNQLIAANVLSNAVYWHKLDRNGSTFKARFGGDLIVSADNWFRPVDCLVGPDGAVYIADWYDRRANHVDPVDTWDRTNGRVYKIQMKSKGATRPDFNLGKLPTPELVKLLGHRNDWFVREARRQLAERRDPRIIPELRQSVLANKGQLALEALWSLYVSGGFDEAVTENFLGHVNADVRTWTVRLLGDAKKVSPAMRERLVQLARGEKGNTVRSQLACTSKRLPGRDGLPIVRALLRHQEDVNDPFIPLLLWWAIEDKAVSDREAVLSLYDGPGAWREPLIEKFITERLGRRYMAEGSEAGYAACARLLSEAPQPADVKLLVQGMEKALEGRRLSKVPAPLEKPVLDLWRKNPSDLLLVRFALRLGSAPAHEQVLRLVADRQLAQHDRVGLIDMLGQIGSQECRPVLMRLLDPAEPVPIRKAALNALQPFTDPQITTAVLAQYPKMPGELRDPAQNLLANRPASALELLKAVDAGKVNPKEVPIERLKRIRQFNKEPHNQIIVKHWGQVGAQTTGEKTARIRAVNHLLNQGKGAAAAGKPLFTKHCATCHTLFGEGAKIGPDLTGADRKNRYELLTHIVDPSAYIRPEFVAHTVETTDGRVLTGLIVESTPNSVTLADSKGEKTVLGKDKIDAMHPSPVSIMPEKLLDTLNEPQLFDLFAFLQSDGPAGQAPTPTPLKVCLVSGSLEYKSDESLDAFQKHLEKNYPVRCSRAFRKTDDDLPGLENLETCDVMLLFTRRLTVKGEQLERVQKYCKAGKPIVAVRTASHAFQNWLALDREILGGDYKGHFGDGPRTQVRVVAKAKDHPILAGVKPFESVGSLYKNPAVAKDVQILQTGTIPGHTEPITWVRVHNGGRVFYTSLGHPEDFKDDNFVRMLVNALFWTAQRELPTGRK